MFPFFESICFRDGVPQNLSRHQWRVKKTFEAFFPGNKIHHLQSILGVRENERGLFKCRFFYGEKDYQVTYEKYIIKKILQLAIKEIGDYRYDYKYSDRHFINQLIPAIPDMEVLLCRWGLLTDVSYANICLWDGITWYTPKEPLLKGTRRALLLDQGVLEKRDIRENEVLLFKKIALINAMLDLGDLVLEITPDLFVEPMNQIK